MASAERTGIKQSENKRSKVFRSKARLFTFRGFHLDLRFTLRESDMMPAIILGVSLNLLSLLCLASRERVLGGECNRASGGLMASRCKCSQSGTQATYPPTDALCQLTPYSLIILFSLLLSFSPCLLYHTLPRARLNYFINPLFPVSFPQPSRTRDIKTITRS